MGHGLALAVSHMLMRRKRRRDEVWDSLGFKPWQRPQPKAPGLVKFGGFLLTVNFVSFMWILFRADDLNQAGQVFRAAIDFGHPGQGAPIMAWFIVALALFMQWAGAEVRQAFLALQNRMSVPALSLWSAFWVIIIIKFGPDGVLPFIYFQY
jgi:hypothetical protein